MRRFLILAVALASIGLGCGDDDGSAPTLVQIHPGASSSAKVVVYAPFGREIWACDSAEVREIIPPAPGLMVEVRRVKRRSRERCRVDLGVTVGAAIPIGQYTARVRIEYRHVDDDDEFDVFPIWETDRISRELIIIVAAGPPSPPA